MKATGLYPYVLLSALNHPVVWKTEAFGCQLMRSGHRGSSSGLMTWISMDRPAPCSHSRVGPASVRCRELSPIADAAASPLPLST